MISDLLVGPNGDVWLAHGDDGISRWNGSGWEEFEPGSAPGFFDGRVDSICLSPAGNVCLGIQGAGVSCFDGSQWTGIGFDGQLVGERVHGIAVDGMGEVYVITSDSDLEDAFLYRFDGTAWIGWDIRGWKSLLAVGPDGTIWLAEAGAGLFNIRSGEWSTDDLAEGLPIEEIRDIVFGPDGSMWVGTDNGAWRYDGTDWRSFLRRDVLLSDYVTEIAVSAENTIWFGGIGLARYGAP